jgi:spermidine/putrescine-binding protein
VAVSWNDIENAIKNNLIESLDKSTLEEYSKVEPHRSLTIQGLQHRHSMSNNGNYDVWHK